MMDFDGDTFLLLELFWRIDDELSLVYDEALNIVRNFADILGTQIDFSTIVRLI
jgi:hypothetical protein